MFFACIKKSVRILTILFALAGFFFVGGYVAMKLKLTNAFSVDEQQESFISTKTEHNEYARFPLAHSPEWVAFRIAVAKDTEVLKRIEKETGVHARLIITPLVPEQMRLFHSERPLFKQVFEPLKILGAQSQFSWGVTGMKEETAREVEHRLKDPSSPSYLGKEYEHLLDFKTANPNEERFLRIINERDHYYSYLYTALYLKQLQTEWKNAGFDISKRPEILGTLYNIGFTNSKPKTDPQIGGAAIDLSGTEYSFGGLAHEFYYSDELVELFPPQIH